MTTFDYTARAGDGRQVRGQIEAVSASAARQQLADRGLEVQRIFSLESKRGGGELSSSEAADLGVYVAEVVESRLPLAPGLRAVSEELGGDRKQRRLAAALWEIAERIEGGASLAAAIEATSQRIPTHLRGIVQAGLRSGRLDELLAWFVDRQQLARRQRRQIISALGYPLVLLGLLAILSMFLSMYVLPPFEDLLDDFGAELPVPTVFAFWLSDVGFKICLVAPLVLAATVGLAALIGGRRAVFHLVYSIPFVGRVFSYNGVAEFSGVLGLLVRQGVPLCDALRLTGEVVRDAAVGAACEPLAYGVESGQSLTQGLSASGRVLAGLVPIVAWGEQHGELGTSLRYADDTYTGWAERQAEFLRIVIPPFTFLFILWSVSVVISGLLLPLVKLMQTLT